FGQELIFEDLSFAINKGEIFVILGKNGAGKSTLIKILLGMIYATKGEVKYAGIKKIILLSYIAKWEQFWNQ
ncbi:MAG: ATP-binding cassette domain-containing protein, partial [Anaerococcus vaginalis]|nr:ATP-binding cassette domain-containing protein [Anaerococcus vaginalis]